MSRFARAGLLVVCVAAQDAFVTADLGLLGRATVRIYPDDQATPWQLWPGGCQDLVHAC